MSKTALKKKKETLTLKIGFLKNKRVGGERGELIRMSRISRYKYRTRKSRPKTRLVQQRDAENDELGRHRRVSPQLAGPIEYPSLRPFFLLLSVSSIRSSCMRGIRNSQRLFSSSPTKTCCPCTVVETNTEHGASRRGREDQGG